MNTADKLTLALSLIGVSLWGLCLIAGLGAGNTRLAASLAGLAFSFILGASMVFWFSEDTRSPTGK